MHPLAPKLLVARMLRSRLNVAVAAGPHVTNRVNLLCAMQTLEAASIIGLIRRTTALAGACLDGSRGARPLSPSARYRGRRFRGEMATEDIDLTWRLLLAGWHTAYEPDALIGMQVWMSEAATIRTRPG
jgi:poly-beta-1,6-N-acetyl-D-glucosamine synthase